MTYFDKASKNDLYSCEWKTQLRTDTNGNHFQIDRNQLSSHQDRLAVTMAYEFQTSMVDDSLVKVDRASMACSLEVRSPFLDHQVVELAMRVPPEYKLKGR